MFGDQAVRLIRENWGGVLNPDVNGDLVEHGATRLAEELYAMFDDNIPLTQNAPLTLNKTNPNAPGLTLNNTVGGNTLTTNGGNVDFNGGDFNVNTPGGNITITGGTTIIPGNGVTIGPTGANGQPGIGTSGLAGSAGAPGADGKDFKLRLPPIKDVTFGDPPTGPSLADLLAQQTRVFLGRVVSGSGKTYKVALYDNGPDASPSATVSASVPQIDPKETIPPGTWVAAVIRFLSGTQNRPVYTYAFQPPVWL